MIFIISEAYHLELGDKLLIIYIAYSDEIHIEIKEPILRTLVA